MPSTTSSPLFQFHPRFTNFGYTEHRGGRIFIYDPYQVATELYQGLHQVGIACKYAFDLDALEAELSEAPIDGVLFISDLSDASQCHELEYLADLLGTNKVRVFPGGLARTSSTVRYSPLILQSFGELCHWWTTREPALSHLETDAPSNISERITASPRF